MRSPTKTKRPAVLEQVRLSDIVVPEGRRRAVKDTAELQTSIQTLGLLQPIIVTRKRILIAGLHRLRACQALGWTTIAASVVDLSELNAELAEIDENLCRNELSALERAEQISRRKVIYEGLHPETRAGHAWALAKHAKVLGNSANAVPAFAEQTATATGKSMRTVQRDVQIAEGLTPEVRDLLRESPVADRVEDLVALAQLGDPAKQAAIAKVIASGQANTLASAQAILVQAEADEETSAEAVHDQLGQAVTDPGIAEAFVSLRERIAEVQHHLRAARRAWGHFHEDQAAARQVRILAAKSYYDLREDLETKLHQLFYSIKVQTPYGICPYCKGAPWVEDITKRCEGCGGGGWMGQFGYKNAPPEMQFHPGLDEPEELDTDEADAEGGEAGHV